jgi:7-keto-8-aminopelargonate synthetase-like enzyme
MLWPVPYESEMKSNSAVVELLNSFEKDGQSFFLDQASHVSNLKAVRAIRQTDWWPGA